MCHKSVINIYRFIVENICLDLMAMTRTGTCYYFLSIMDLWKANNKQNNLGEDLEAYTEYLALLYSLAFMETATFQTYLKVFFPRIPFHEYKSAFFLKCLKFSISKSNIFNDRQLMFYCVVKLEIKYHKMPIRNDRASCIIASRIRVN